MARTTLFARATPKDLKVLLSAIFLALALPTGIVAWQAFDKLKLESFYQARDQAEAITLQIDTLLRARFETANARAPSDFTFQQSAGSGGIVQRSPLAGLPIVADLPGTLGYFQVDPAGQFSSPLLPQSANATSGLSETDLAAREQLAQELRSILASNELVTAGRTQHEPSVPVESVPDDSLLRESPAAPSDTTAAGAVMELSNDYASSKAITDEDTEQDEYSQAAFDALNSAERRLSSGTDAVQDRYDFTQDRVATSPASRRERQVLDLPLNDDLQKRATRGASAEQSGSNAPTSLSPPSRSPQAAPGRPLEEVANAEITQFDEEKEALPRQASGIGDTITTFDSDIGRYQFSALDSGQLVMFRNVWQDDQRLVQGMLLDTQLFLQLSVSNVFGTSALAELATLTVGFRGAVVADYSVRSMGSTAPSQQSLLHRSSLSAPFDQLELVFSYDRLPASASADLLKWLVAIIVLVFLSGFYALYRLGLGQLALARQQQDFVSAVSHELKTPLTSIRMYGEMLREGWVDDDKRQQYYAYIQDESERLSRLIGNVLQLSQIDRDATVLDLKPIQVATLIDQVESKIARQVESAGFSLETHNTSDADAATINIDEDGVLQIFINLIDNAIKFSRNAENKTVDLATSLSQRGTVVFSVRDYGPGIPKSQMKKIFELFYRSESELTRETVGTGIGLAIVHQLTTTMGGKIDVSNAEPGARFDIEFPIDKARDNS